MDGAKIASLLHHVQAMNPHLPSTLDGYASKANLVNESLTEAIDLCWDLLHECVTEGWEGVLPDLNTEVPAAIQPRAASVRAYYDALDLQADITPQVAAHKLGSILAELRQLAAAHAAVQPTLDHLV